MKTATRPPDSTCLFTEPLEFLGYCRTTCTHVCVDGCDDAVTKLVEAAWSYRIRSYYMVHSRLSGNIEGFRQQNSCALAFFPMESNSKHCHSFYAQGTPKQNNMTCGSQITRYWHAASAVKYRGILFALPSAQRTVTGLEW